MGKNAGKAAVRCTAIDMSGLAAMEAHGKRLDKSSQARIIRDASPLVYGSLDLRPAYDAHMKGVRQNSAAKKSVLHFVVRFPPELLAGDKLGHFDGDKEARQKMMLRQAVQFVNQTHGGSAVFAARVDRDETGETIVDVFASPRYEKRTKKTPADEAGAIWASATKFGKDLALAHEDEIRRRHPKAKPSALTSPRMIGIALQSEFAAWFQRINGVPLAPKVEKGTFAPDRLEKEAHDRIERRANIQARWDARRSRRLDARAEQIETRKTDVQADLEAVAIDLDAERAELVKVRQDLDRRESLLAEKVGILRRAFDKLDRFIDLVGSKLGLRLPDDLSQALDQIERKGTELSAPENPRDDSGLGF